jgi:hypothetical protein
MAKRAADTELQNLRAQPRTRQDMLCDVVRKACVSGDDERSDSPITFIAIDEDAYWYKMLYWPADETVGLRVLKTMYEPRPDVSIIEALMCLSIGRHAQFRDSEADDLLCKTFSVQKVSELGVFSEVATEYLDHGKLKRTDPSKSVPESELHPARCTILMHCYE